MDRAPAPPRTALCILAALLAPLSVAGCSPEARFDTGSSGPTGSVGDPGSTAASVGSAGGAEGDGGSGAGVVTASTSTGGDAGGGGAAGGLVPWTSSFETCDGALVDDDADGLVDEDCAPSLFTGVFVPMGVGLTTPGVLDAIEADAGRPVPVLQTYRSTSVAGAANARADLEAIWDRGGVPHLNVEPSGYAPSQYQLAGDDPALSSDVRAMAEAVAASLRARPEGRVLLTFAAEMNGDWVDWGCLAPETFVAFYRWAHGVFDAALAEGGEPVDPRRVRWVFGPNNVSAGGCAPASSYYPGHGHTDHLGMSSYRSGTQTADSAVVAPAHALLDAVGLAEELRTDRFIVLQTGSREEPSDDRDAWIRDLFARLEADSIFRGAIYFDAAEWSVIDQTTRGEPIVERVGYAGLVDAIASAPPADARLEGTFDPFFWDVPFGHASYPEVQSMRAAGIASGCALAPPRFCPDGELTRAHAAAWLARAFAVAISPDDTVPVFADVTRDLAERGAIEALAELGALEPCGADTFCPSAAITRGDLARALVRLAGIEGAPTGPAPFEDLGVTGEDGAIQLLGEVGHLDGCTGFAGVEPELCPGQPALRAAGARWIVRTAAVPPGGRLGP